MLKKLIGLLWPNTSKTPRSNTPVVSEEPEEKITSSLVDTDLKDWTAITLRTYTFLGHGEKTVATLYPITSWSWNNNILTFESPWRAKGTTVYEKDRNREMVTRLDNNGEYLKNSFGEEIIIRVQDNYLAYRKVRGKTPQTTTITIDPESIWPNTDCAALGQPGDHIPIFTAAGEMKNEIVGTYVQKMYVSREVKKPKLLLIKNRFHALFTPPPSESYR